MDGLLALIVGNTIIASGKFYINHNANDNSKKSR